MIQTKSFIYICLLFMFFGNTSYAQPRPSKVYMHYREPALVINEIPKNYRVPYEELDVFLFETDSLFSSVRKIKVNNKVYPIHEYFLLEPIVRIELLDDTKCFYLLDYNKKVVAACYPEESSYEIQWFSNGLNSAIKQWEEVSVNINYDFDESMENTFISYEKIVLERRIDKDKNPEDFELSINYIDKDGDGIIERKKYKTNK